MRVYLVAVVNKTAGEVCVDCNGAYEEYVGAVYALGK